MFSNVQLMTVGIVAVLETALLAALLERRNRRLISLWIVLLLIGAWAWHSATFVYALLGNPQGYWPQELQWLAMVVMVTALLLMPSALLHGAGRLWKSGIDLNPPWRPAYLVCYLPLVLAVPLAWQLHRDPAQGFLQQLHDYVFPYLGWITWVNLLAAGVAIRFSQQLPAPSGRQFLRWFAAMLVVITVSTASLTLPALNSKRDLSHWFTLAVTLLPALPALLFGYFVIRFQFMSVVLERTLVYGAIAVSLMLFHQVALQDLTSSLSHHYHVDFGIVEVAVGIGLIVLYQPLRQRAAEALRYLMGSRVSVVRDRTRELSVQMSERASQSPDMFLAWFTEAVREAMHVEWTAAWLFVPAGMTRNEQDAQPSRKEEAVGTLPSQTWAQGGATDRIPPNQAAELYRDLFTARLTLCADYEAPTDLSSAAMSEADAAWAIRIDHPRVAGLLLLGRAPWNRQPGEEELNSLVMLVEQLGSTLHNSQLQSERMTIERRALQNEKLATLGLMAGSIAHEIKNPLSSIKTLATVVSEQLGEASPLAEDLRLIVSEVDRLSATTSQLLDFARPQPAGQGGIAGNASSSVTGHVERLLRLMRHLASQKQVTLESAWIEPIPAVTASDAALQEIFFNLLSNALEATEPGGKVRVSGAAENGCVRVTVADTGRGMSPELQSRVFEPFITTKETGTGLGLHVVGQRVRELGGEIHCTSMPEQGTQFLLRLPFQNSTGNGRTTEKS